MLKLTKTKKLILLISTIIIGSYLFITTVIGNDKFNNFKSLLNDEKKQLIKKYIFPYKYISQQEQMIFEYQNKINPITILNEQPLIFIMAELYKKVSGSDIEIKHKKNEGEDIINLSNNLTLKKYKLISGFYAGINNIFPGSGYIDFYEDNIIVLSSRGVLAFKKNIEDIEKNFQQIQNNINKFIGINQFKKKKMVFIKRSIYFQ